jgi:glycosyltransferase involved in cell wall biosynthesis
MGSRRGEASSVKIGIVVSCVPFIAGRAEYLADELRTKFVEAGQAAIVVSIPFKHRPLSAIIDQIVACRSLRLPNTDLMIGLDFPAFCLPHSNKITWLVEQFSNTWGVWRTSRRAPVSATEEQRVRKGVMNAENIYLQEARKIYTGSQVTSDRLLKEHSISSEVLCPPLIRSDSFHPGESGDYVLYLGPISDEMRQKLLIEAAHYVKTNVRVIIAGQPQTPADLQLLRRTIVACRVEHRVTILPEFMPETQKSDLLANALACIYIPSHEDSSSQLPLQACHCRKPLVTCTDSQRSSFFINDRVTGRRVPPDPVIIAAAIDELYNNRELARQWGDAGFEEMRHRGIHWDNVIQKLTS